MRRRLVFLLIVLLISAVACQRNSIGESQGSVPNAADSSRTYRLAMEEVPANLGQLKMNLNQLGAFHGRFVLAFTGQTDWIYQVDTRSDGTNIEYQLTLHGLDNVQDLGDVRLVNTMERNYMHGPGIGNLCVQFPDEYRTEPLFLGPTDFIRLKEFSNLPEETGKEVLLKRETVRYSASSENHLGWKDVSVTFWIDSQTDAVLKYEFYSQGNDPLYQRGEGQFHGVFEVLEVGPQQIEGIPGCVIEFPMPQDAAGIIRFPGLISFTSSMGLSQLDNFYTQALESNGWVREESQINEQTGDGVLEYSSQNGSVIINFATLNQEDFSQGFMVEIFLEE